MLSRCRYVVDAGDAGVVDQDVDLAERSHCASCAASTAANGYATIITAAPISLADGKVMSLTEIATLAPEATKRPLCAAKARAPP